jgi:spore germination cell wall hydrolase CwlJ-like protein
MAVAAGAYEELHAPVVPGALYYHATNVRPSWANSRTVIGTVGNHVFYR